MIKLNIHEVKTHLSRYLEVVEGGETVIVCKRNIPIAEIRPIEKKKKRLPKLGWAEGQGKVSPSFDAPLTESELRLWYEGHSADPLREYAPKSKTPKK